MITRRELIHVMAGAVPGLGLLRGLNGRGARQPSPRSLPSGPFQPAWESLKQYRAPDWFRDAKFGIWAHWTAQCVPEQGDWYARRMYLQGDAAYDFHLKTYGHPSEFGFMEIDNLWRAEHWEPAAARPVCQAGAKYFVALTRTITTFDAYDSSHRLELRPHRAKRHRKHLGATGARPRTDSA